MTYECPACDAPAAEGCPHTAVRGHIVRLEGERWVSVATGEPVPETAPCARCGRAYDLCGICGLTDHDPCMGHIEGATSACCGHGLTIGFVVIGAYGDLADAEGE